MAKKRTRKEKKQAKHPFLRKTKDEPETFKVDMSVKRQIKNKAKAVNKKKKIKNLSEIQAKDAEIQNIKRDIFKSIILASLILVFEIVLYFARNA